MTTNLEGIDLSESFVVGWKIADAQVVFQVEFALSPSSPFYRRPRGSEWTCFRRGVLTFERVTAIDGLRKQQDVPFSTDAAGEKDFGNIDFFESKDGEARLLGDFGNVLLKCSAWHLAFADEESI